jgi:CRISPR-associated protein Csd1
LLILNNEGRFVDLQDTQSGEGRKRVARVFTVPKAVKKTSGIAANLLWGTPAYIFGRPKPNPKKDPANLAKRAAEQRRCFFETLRERLAPVISDDGVAAVNRFLELGDFNAVFAHPAWPEIEEKGLLLSFQLSGDTCLVCERPKVVEIVECPDNDGNNLQVCLITGEKDKPSRTHTAIKGVKRAQTSGANIVSFNLPAFTSHGKEQGLNAPVGKKAEAAYTTALNHMLMRGSRQRIQVGDSTTVFWAEKKHEIESVFAKLFGEPAKGEPEQDYKQLVALFRAAESGAPPHLDLGTWFYVLGLSPNAARIAVRFWYVGTVRETADNILRHFDDLEMVKGAKEWRTITLRSLLRAIAALGKDDNVPPNLAGDTMKAILACTPYPQTLLSAAVRRCRAERDVTYPRAALIKAVLVRDNRFGRRFSRKHEKEVSMSLDTRNTNAGYLLGRLFAVLEKAQEEANPGINATIRDRFYGAASATPVAAFPHLMKLKNHHLSKLENRGRAVNLEKMIGEIIGGISDFPAHLSLADQGRFAVGYYHQRQAFFTSSKKDQ